MDKRLFTSINWIKALTIFSRAGHAPKNVTCASSCMPTKLPAHPVVHPFNYLCKKKLLNKVLTCAPKKCKYLCTKKVRSAIPSSDSVLCKIWQGTVQFSTVLHSPHPPSRFAAQPHVSTEPKSARRRS